MRKLASARPTSPNFHTSGPDFFAGSAALWALPELFCAAGANEAPLTRTNAKKTKISFMDAMRANSCLACLVIGRNGPREHRRAYVQQPRNLSAKRHRGFPEPLNVANHHALLERCHGVGPFRHKFLSHKPFVAG